MIAGERETVATLTDADDYVRVYTCRRPDITALKKKLDKGVILDREGVHSDGSPFAYFRIPKSSFDISRGVKGTRTLTPEQREALSERMKDVQNRKRAGTPAEAEEE